MNKKINNDLAMKVKESRARSGLLPGEWYCSECGKEGKKIDMVALSNSKDQAHFFCDNDCLQDYLQFAGTCYFNHCFFCGKEYPSRKGLFCGDECYLLAMPGTYRN